MFATTAAQGKKENSVGMENVFGFKDDKAIQGQTPRWLEPD